MASWAKKLETVGQPMKAYVEKAVAERMAANPVIKDIKLKGDRIHASHDGSGKQVISVQMLNERNARVETIHVDKEGNSDVKKKSQ